MVVVVVVVVVVAVVVVVVAAVAVQQYQLTSCTLLGPVRYHRSQSVWVMMGGGARVTMVTTRARPWRRRAARARRLQTTTTAPRRWRWVTVETASVSITCFGFVISGYGNERVFQTCCWSFSRTFRMAN